MREIVVVVSTRRKVFSSLSLFPLTLEVIRALEQRNRKETPPKLRNSDKNQKKNSFDLETKEKNQEENVIR